MRASSGVCAPVLEPYQPATHSFPPLLHTAHKTWDEYESARDADYASFPQHDYEVKVSEDNVKDIIQTYWKTDEEKAQFGEGLGLMANLYSSPRVTVLRVGHYPTKQPALPGAHAYPHLNDSGFKCCAGAKRPPPRDTETWQERMADGTFEFRYGRSGWVNLREQTLSLPPTNSNTL